jgi:hypothetical protein
LIESDFEEFLIWDAESVRHERGIHVGRSVTGRRNYRVADAAYRLQRAPSMRRYTDMLPIRLTPKDMARLQVLADRKGMTPVTLGRELIVKSLKRAECEPLVPEWLELLLLECYSLRSFVLRCLSEIQQANGWSAEKFNREMAETQRRSERFARQRIAPREDHRREDPHRR